MRVIQLFATTRCIKTAEHALRITKVVEQWVSNSRNQQQKKNVSQNYKV